MARASSQASYPNSALDPCTKKVVENQAERIAGQSGQRGHCHRITERTEVADERRLGSTYPSSLPKSAAHQTTESFLSGFQLRSKSCGDLKGAKQEITRRVPKAFRYNDGERSRARHTPSMKRFERIRAEIIHPTDSFAPLTDFPRQCHEIGRTSGLRTRDSKAHSNENE